MYDFIGAPVLKLILVGCFLRIRRCLGREMRRHTLLRGAFEVLKGSHVLSLDLIRMRIYDLVLLLTVEGFEIVVCANSLYGVVALVLPLVIRVHAGWVVVPDYLIHHLSTPGPTHEMLVVLNEVD